MAAKMISMKFENYNSEIHEKYMLIFYEFIHFDDSCYEREGIV